MAGSRRPSEIWDLPALGIHGNTHMMMMDRNSDVIVARLIDWLDEQHRRGALASPLESDSASLNRTRRLAT